MWLLVFCSGEKKKWMPSLSLKRSPLIMGVFDEVRLCGYEYRVRMVIPVVLTHW